MRHTSLGTTYPGRYDTIMEVNGYGKISDYLDGEGGRVLDIGCSVGIETARLAAENPGHYFIGMDIEPPRIAIARRGIWSLKDVGITQPRLELMRRIPGFEVIESESAASPALWLEFEGCFPVIMLRRPLDNLGFVVGDYDEPPFAPHSFDVVTAFTCGFRGSREASVMPLIRPGGVLLNSLYAARA